MTRLSLFTLYLSSSTVIQLSMYGGGPNYSGGHHHQSSSRAYQNPNQLGGGYSSGPSFNADRQLLEWFNSVDTDRSGSISVAELQAALVNGQRPFLIFSRSSVDGSRNDTGNWSSECPSSSSSELENHRAPSPHRNAPFLLKSHTPVLIQSCNLRIRPGYCQNADEHIRKSWLPLDPTSHLTMSLSRIRTEMGP